MRFTSLLLFLFTFSAHAEYRAFELVITDPTTGQERVMLSNLDPNQFRRYYSVKATETVKYRSTWMCRGNTSGPKAMCLKPEPKN